jgi:hypothetical protein
MIDARVICARFLCMSLILSARVVTPAYANVGETFGFGARSASLAGATVAAPTDGYSAYINPAALALSGDKRLVFSYGLLSMHPTFKPIDNVIVRNDYTAGSATPEPGNVDMNYRGTTGQAFGLAYRLAPQSGDRMNLSIGIMMFVPLNQIAYVDTGEAFVPEFFLYRARTQRPQIQLGTAIEPSLGWKVGLGLQIGYTLSSSATMFLTSNPARASSLRFSASMKPKATPYFGLLWDSDPDFTLGLVARAPLTSDGVLNVTAGTQFLSSPSLDLGFVLRTLSALYYDPATLELGTTWRHSGASKLHLQVDYQLWQQFKPPVSTINGVDLTSCVGSCGFAFTPSKNPIPTFRNILVPRIGEEISLNDDLTLRVGYSYRPSIIKEVPTEAGNYLDPAKHIFNAGLGFRFQTFLGFQTPSVLDVNATYQDLVDQAVIKSTGDETGAAGLKVGAPGYLAGGRVYGGGASVTVAF